MVSLCPSMAHTSISLQATPVEADGSSEEIGMRLGLSSVESSPLDTEDSDGMSENRDGGYMMEFDGINCGTLEEFHSLQNTSLRTFQLINSVENQCMRLMVPVNPNILKQEGMRMENLVTYEDNGEYLWHPGTDGKETEWETEYLPNYRLVLFLFTYDYRMKHGMESSLG